MEDVKIEDADGESYHSTNFDTRNIIHLEELPREILHMRDNYWKRAAPYKAVQDLYTGEKFYLNCNQARGLAMGFFNPLILRYKGYKLDPQGEWTIKVDFRAGETKWVNIEVLKVFDRSRLIDFAYFHDLVLKSRDWWWVKEAYPTITYEKYYRLLTPKSNHLMELGTMDFEKNADQETYLELTSCDRSSAASTVTGAEPARPNPTGRKPRVFIDEI